MGDTTWGQGHNFRVRSCIVHDTQPRIALLARPPHHAFPAPPTYLTVRIETSPHSLRRLNDGLAGHHAIRNHNLVVLLRFNHEGMKRGHCELSSRYRLRFSTPSANLRGQVVLCIEWTRRQVHIARTHPPHLPVAPRTGQRRRQAFPYSELDLEGGARDPALPND